VERVRVRWRFRGDSRRPAVGRAGTGRPYDAHGSWRGVVVREPTEGGHDVTTAPRNQKEAQLCKAALGLTKGALKLTCVGGRYQTEAGPAGDKLCERYLGQVGPADLVRVLPEIVQILRDREIGACPNNVLLNVRKVEVRSNLPACRKKASRSTPPRNSRACAPCRLARCFATGPVLCPPYRTRPQGGAVEPPESEHGDTAGRRGGCATHRVWR
jgi:hypothetical protein